MESMIERVAKQLYKKMYLREDWENAKPHFKERARDAARTAIKAMRTPTKAMVSAAESVRSETEWVWTGESEIGVEGKADPTEVYHTMIDAALKESNDGNTAD